MSNNNLHVHNVSHVVVETEEVGFDSGNGYTVRRVDIHSVDHAGKAETLRVTLYGITGEQGIPEVPITYLKVERDAQ